MPSSILKPGWRRFIQANDKFCSKFLEPRLYTVSHMSAIDWWFERRALELSSKERLLEFGSGRSFPVSRALGRLFAATDATDIEDVPREDWPQGVTFRRCEPARLPFPDAQFDLIIIRSVLEHVENPEDVFAELSRVLKPGGAIAASVPNRWDYVSVISRLAGPFKSRLLHGLVPGAWDDFPVYYRCNTKGAIRRLADSAGLTPTVIRPMPSEPSCLKFFVPFYMLGACYQFAISLLALDALQPAFVMLLRKPTAQTAPRR